MSMMVLFVLFFFPRGVLDEILNLIESVSQGFPSYFWSTANKLVEAPPPQPLQVILLLAVQRRVFCFGSLVVLDVICGYVFLFVLDIKIENR